MKKLNVLKVGLAIAGISLLVGALYFSLLSSQPLTLIGLSNILFVEFLLFFSVGNLLYFKKQFWQQRPWQEVEDDEEGNKDKANDEDDKDLNPDNKGRNLILISLPLGIISILITLF